MPDPAVRVEAIAATLGTSANLINRRIKCGDFPAPDAVICRKRPTGWRISTITAWNSQVGARLARAIEADAIPAY